MSTSTLFQEDRRIYPLGNFPCLFYNLDNKYQTQIQYREEIKLNENGSLTKKTVHIISKNEWRNGGGRNGTTMKKKDTPLEILFQKNKYKRENKYEENR